MKHKSLQAIFLILPFVLGMCAKMLTPSGGPKDTTPPKLVKMQPDVHCLNFSGNTFKITFNEYIVLNNPTENCIFSPPLKYTPRYTVKNKTLSVKILDTLRPNTTYNVVFTDCIKDFTEGNPLPYLQYTFSTGDAIDTFSFSGKLIDSKEPDPVKNCLVFLYRDDIDSLPLTTRPDYITRTLADGTFNFYNIAKGDYKIFALNDINKNLIYDLPNEEIAFGDAPVSATPMPPAPQVPKDTTTMKKGAKKNKKNNTDDTAVTSPTAPADTSALQNELFLFTEKDTTLKLIACNNPAQGIYYIIFNNEAENLSIDFIDRQKALPYYKAISETEDTITLYFKELPQDTIELAVNCGEFTDTLTLLPFKTKSQKGGRGKKTVTVPKLNVTTLNSGELYKPFTLSFPYPLKPADNIEYQIVKKKKSGNDTTTARLSIPDTFVTAIEIPFDKEEKVPYNISFRDSVFYAYNGLTNDSLSFNFTLHSEKEYGNLIINYNIEKAESYLVQLLTTNGKLICKNTITNSQKIVYEHLTPGEYKIKVIEDRNRNGKWDTGNYRKKEQPEKIFYFTKKITIRGYWELEENFNF